MMVPLTRGDSRRGHFRRDPTADGVADDGDVAQRELVEQGDVQRREFADGFQCLGSRRSQDGWG